MPFMPVFVTRDTGLFQASGRAMVPPPAIAQIATDGSSFPIAIANGIQVLDAFFPRPSIVVHNIEPVYADGHKGMAATIVGGAPPGSFGEFSLDAERRPELVVPRVKLPQDHSL